MTPDVFLGSFPEFANTEPVLIQAKMAQAAARMGGPDVTVWGPFAAPGQAPSIADIAHGNLAAHYLMSSPFGFPNRLDSSKGGGKTPYLEVFDDLCGCVAGGFMTSGEIGGLSPGTTGASGSLNLAPGAGTVAVTNGSTAITFQLAQSFPAGTVLVFVSAQPGALYALYANVAASTSGVLTAPYSGVTNGASSWNVGAG